MRKYLIGYPIWGGKRDMITYLIQGIRENIDPDQADVVFLFTNCVDDSYDKFIKNQDLLEDYCSKAMMYTGDDLAEGEQHNILMKVFMQDYLQHKALIVPQDDNRINGTSLISDLNLLLDVAGDSIGLVGGRDGYNPGYADMVGSPFSGSDNYITRRLAIGEFEQRMMLNTGPLVYTRSTIEKVGLNDPENKIYAMDDYALRAHFLGLKNYVMGMEILHKQFGKLGRPSNQENLTRLAAPNGQAMNEKWGPKLGRSLY